MVGTDNHDRRCSERYNAHKGLEKHACFIIAYRFRRWDTASWATYLPFIGKCTSKAQGLDQRCRTWAWKAMAMPPNELARRPRQFRAAHPAWSYGQRQRAGC